MPVLTDVLTPSLKAVFVGLAAGSASASTGAYYAGPGNFFWPLLFELGLTPRRLKPSEYTSMLDFGLGLTLLASEHTGDEEDLPGVSEEERQAFYGKMLQFSPRVIAFTSRRAGEEYLGHPVDLGFERCDRIAGAQTFILPSTAAGQRRFWESSYWHAMADYVRRLRG